MPLEIARNEKFGCLAIQNASVAEELRGQIELAPGLWCVDRLPFGVGDFWTNQLGEGRVEQIMRSNVLIFCIAPAQNPQVLDGENQVLTQRVQRIYCALLMQLVFHHDGVELFSGARVDENPDIREITDIRNHFRPGQVRVGRISRENLLRAAGAERGIEEYLRRTGGADRLWHGFHALQRGFLEYWSDERLHQFVRAIEAVLSLEAGRSRTQFAHRAQLFSGRSDENRQWLLELYDLRSATEHLNDYRAVLEHHPAGRREDIAALRSYEAQVLACHIYLRLAESAALRGRFGDDANLEQFWGLREGAVDKSQRARIVLAFADGAKPDHSVVWDRDHGDVVFDPSRGVIQMSELFHDAGLQSYSGTLGMTAYCYQPGWPIQTLIKTEEGVEIPGGSPGVK